MPALSSGLFAVHLDESDDPTPPPQSGPLPEAYESGRFVRPSDVPPPPARGRRRARASVSPPPRRTRATLPPPPPERPPPAPGGETIVCGISEFGLRLAELLGRHPTMRGAVLTDDEGNPVDFARRPSMISSLDLQIVGAQVERVVFPIDRSCAKLGIGRTAQALVIEASHGALIACSLLNKMFVLVVTLAPTEELAPLLMSFDNTAREITSLLDA